MDQNDYLEPYVHHMRQLSFAESTIVRNRRHVAGFLAHLSAKGVPVERAGRQELQDHLATLSGLGLKPSSVRIHQCAVRSFQRFLHEQGVGAAPGAFIRMAEGEQLPKAIGEQEAARLLDSVSGLDPVSLRDRALLELAYATGLRSAELLRIRRADLDLPGRTVRVLGKGKREALVCFGESAAMALERYLADGWYMLRVADTEALFLNSHGGPLQAVSLWRMVSSRAKAAGIKRHVHPHMLRHSFATHLMNAGANLRVIQELMRHRSLASTAVYTRLDTNRLAEERRKYHPRT